MKNRHFEFFPEHWKGDVALRLCSSAARGLWIDMLCEMHSATPYGHLATPTGIPIATIGDLARIVGEKTSDVKKWLGELEKAEVFSRTDSGLIYSRRMVRDKEGRDKWAQSKKRWREKDDLSSQSPSDVQHDVHDDVSLVSEQSPTDKGKGKGKKDTANAVKPGAIAPGKRSRPRIEPGPDFGDLEPDVLAFLAVVAAENRSGMLTEGRIASIRRELHESLDRIGDRGAFAHGLREAVKHGAGNVRYAAKASASYTPLMASRTAETSEPEPELAVLDDYADELEADRVRRESHA